MTKPHPSQGFAPNFEAFEAIKQKIKLDARPLTELKGVGPALAQQLKKLDIHSVEDLLFHLPLRYLDRTRIVPIGDLEVEQSVLIQGTISHCQVVFGRRRSLMVNLRDETGQITLRFFHFSAAQKNQLSEGAVLRCYGDTRRGANGVEIYHPEYEFVGDKPEEPLDQSLTPVYPTTEGLNQTRLRKLTRQVVDQLKSAPPEELLPPEINQRFGVESLSQALAYIHYPPKNAPVDALQAGTHPYQQRLAFEELLAHHFALQHRRWLAQQEQAPQLHASTSLLQLFRQQLPFAPTQAQERVINEIAQDMAKQAPMLRLVQGDVGSGKTLVAVFAALAAIDSGYQVALAAPTEILAEQHRNNMSAWLNPLGFEVAWLVGKLTAKQKRETLAKIAQAEAQLIVGTHALFEDTVEFAKIGLVIIDEQHRFGVHQRLALRDKSHKELRPHQLVMTATPIPRSLAMTHYGDLDLSVIDQLPPGRTPINTVLISQQKRQEVVERIAAACEQGRQVYWVCTLVEDSETLSAAAAEETCAQLQSQLPHLNIGLIHGRLKPKDKERTMAAFKSGELQLLVATTVIEVGVDVPNASLMIIENPERLGLAQLHQLRGRVGRGSIASHCVLMYGHPLSKIARQRLKVLRESTDGFEIAEQDLLIRGPGELLGTRQTGQLTLRLADLQRDQHLLDAVNHTADQILSNNSQIGAKIIFRWFSNQTDYLKG